MGGGVVVMSQGAVRQIGTPADVYAEPADTFVATFLGSPPMTILPGSDVIVGFRPEHFLPPGVAERLGDPLSFGFQISHGEYLGAERVLYGNIAGGAFDGRKAVSRIPATHAVALPDGSLQTFAVALGDVKFFDPQTEKRTTPRSIPA